MADRNGRIEIEAQIDQSLQAALNNISASVRNVLEVTNSLAKTTASTTNSADQLTRALTGANSASTLYTRATHSLISNQAVLANHFKNTGKAASELEKIMSRNTTMTNQERKAVEQLTQSLRAQESARKGVMKFAEQGDMRKQSDALNQLANRYSMSGMRMTMAMTLPIASFMRNSFTSLKTLDKEVIRTTKLIGDSYTSAADAIDASGKRVIEYNKNALDYTKIIDGQVVKVKTLEGAMKSLGSQLDSISMKYGISRELVQGLTGDFAELGIEEVNTLGGLVDLTAAVEKLGNVDIAQSQEFIKTIFQTVLRMKRETGTLEVLSDGTIDYANSIAEVRQQLALFNLLENKTQLSLKSTAEAFPEVTAAATSFGLSMSEAMALVVPMVSAGFQLGASANSVKVSLQRMVDLTKENSQMIETLKQNYSGFNFEAGVSIETIQDLTYAYQNMQRGTLGAQGTLEFFSSLFGVRQGPRMAVSIQNLAQFQDQITKGLEALSSGQTFNETVEGNLVSRLEKAVQFYAKFEGLGEKFTGMRIQNFEQISEVVKLSQSSDEKTARAFMKAREDVAKFLSEEAKVGNDVISKITTESGRALVVGALGNIEGKRKFDQEVTASLQTLEARYNRARETIKAIGRQIVPILGNVLDAVLPILRRVADLIEKMPDSMKAFLGLGLIFLAAIGPVMKLFGSVTQLRSSLLSLRASGGVFGKIKSQTKEISAEFLTANSAALRFKNRLVEIGGKFLLQGTAKEIKQLEKLMSLEARGVSNRKTQKLEKKLGLRGRDADMVGLSEATRNAIMARDSGSSDFMGYRKNIYKDPMKTASVMIYKKAGEEIGHAFLGVLRAQGFDPNSIVKKPKARVSEEISGVPVNIRRVGGESVAPRDDNPPDDGGGGGSRGPSPRPSGGSGGGGIASVPVNISRRITEDAERAVQSVPNSSPIIKKSYMDLKTAIEKATKKNLIEMANSLKIVKIDGKSLAQTRVGDLRKAMLNYFSGAKEGLTFLGEEKKKVKKAVIATAGANAPPAVEKASEEGTKSVQSAQAKKDVKAIKKQSDANEKAIKQSSAQIIPQSSGTLLKGISPKAQKFASTVDQVFMNAQISVNKPIDEIIKSLNLIGDGSRKVPFIFTKSKFFELANTLGIQLPPIFNQMGELVDANGNALRVTKNSLIELIQAMTRTAKAPAVLSNIAGQTALEFEIEVNRALALGTGSKKRFNFKGVKGKLQDAFSRAFSTESGSIFSDIAGKATSRQGAQSGGIDYTKIGYSDLEQVGGLVSRRRSGSKNGAKYNQELIKAAERIRKQVDIEPPVSMQEFREYVKTARGVVDSLLAQTVGGRAKRAVRRRELTFGPRYQQLLSSPKALDLMSEEAYNEFASLRQVGIDAAKAKSEEMKNLFGGYSKSGGRILPSIMSMLSPASYSRYKPTNRVMQSFDEKKANKAAMDELSQIGSRNQTIPPIINPQTKKVLFDSVKRVQELVGKRTQELVESYGSLDQVPKGALRSAQESAISQIKRQMNESQRRQVGDINAKNKKLEGILLDTGLTDARRKEVKKEIAANEKLVKEIQKAFDQEAKRLQAISKSAPIKPTGGGTGTTAMGVGTSMMDPFGGLGGRKAGGMMGPQIGPKLAFIDTGAITGGVNSVYEEIRQSLNIPPQIMDQVISELKVKHNKITTIGAMAKTEVGSGLNQLISALQTSLNGTEMSVENVKQAIVDQRNAIYRLTDKVKKTSASKSDQDALVAKTMESIVQTKTATNEFLTFTDRPLRKLAEALNKLSGGQFKIDTKAKVEVRKQQISDALRILGVTVSEVITNDVVTPIRQADQTISQASSSIPQTIATQAANAAQSVEKLEDCAETTVRDVATSVDRACVQIGRSAATYMTGSSVLGSMRPQMPKYESASDIGARVRANIERSQQVRAARSGAMNRGMDFVLQNTPTVSSYFTEIAQDLKITGTDAKNSLKEFANFIRNGAVDIRNAVSNPQEVGKFSSALQKILNPFTKTTPVIDAIYSGVAKTFTPDKITKVNDFMAKITKAFGSLNMNTIFAKPLGEKGLDLKEATGLALAKQGRLKPKQLANLQETMSRKGDILVSPFENQVQMGASSALGFIYKTLQNSRSAGLFFNNSINKIVSGISTTLRVGSSTLAVGTVYANTAIFNVYKEIGKTAIKAASGLIGDIKPALNALSLVAGAFDMRRAERMGEGFDRRTPASRFVGRLKAGARIGSGSFGTQFADIDFANMNLAKKLGALAGIITMGGAQFGIEATKLSAKLSLSLIPFGSTALKFSSTIFNASIGVVKATKTLSSSFTETAKKAREANSDISSFKTTLAGLKGVGLTTAKGIGGMLPGVLTKGASKAGSGVMGAASKLRGGIAGAGRTAVGTATRGAGSAVSMLAYQFGTVGMVAAPMLDGIINKLAMMPKVAGPLIIAIMAIVGVFMLLKKTTGAWSKFSDGAIEKFKMAWMKLKEIFGLILAPVFDFFASLMGGTKDGKGAMESFGNTIGNVADKILLFLPKIEQFVKKYVVPAVRQILSGVKVAFEAIGPLVKAVIDFVKMIVRLFKGDFSGAWDAVKSIFGNLKEAIGKLLKGIVIILAPILKLVIKLFFMMMTGVINILEQIPIFFVNAMRWMVKGVINLLFMIPKTSAKVNDLVLEGIAKLVRGIGGAFSWIPGLGDKIAGAADWIGNKIGGAMNFVGNAVQSAQNSVLGFVDGAADGVNRFIGSASNISASLADSINGAIDKLVDSNLIADGIGKEVKDGIQGGVDDSMDDPTVPNAAGEAIGKAIKDAVKNALKDLQESFYDAVIANFSDAIKKSSDEIADILNKQKDDALEAFDDQIDAINALAEAEERLSATEEYESNRRQRIRDRELQRNNYQKNRALAIYEGRVDDARNLDLEELKNADDFSKELFDLDKNRQKQLQGQNRDDAISIIKNNREKAAKFFEEAIKEFQDYVEEVTKNGTISEAQLTEQFGKIAEKAKLTATGIDEDFKKLFSELPSLIQSGLDPSTSESGFFSVEMDKLVQTAKTKFGIDQGISTQDASSILGVTGILLSSTSQGIPASISTAFAPGGIIQTTYGTGLTNLNTYIANKNDPSNPESLAAIMAKAIADANIAMEQELRKGQRGIGSAFESIVKGLNEEVKKLAVAEAIGKAMQEAAKTAEQGAKDVVNAAKNGASSAGSGGSAPTATKFWVAIRGSNGKWGDWRHQYTKAAIESYEKKAKDDPNNYKIKNSVEKPAKLFKGGLMKYIRGGFTLGGMNKEIPAILHGGEFVIRKSAVDKYGLDMLSQINKGIYMPKKPMINVPMASYAKISSPAGSNAPMTSESTHNYNFYVDNFIGETEWFNSMMKEYNMKVVPSNQKQAGLESRIIKTYNGINRGM